MLKLENIKKDYQTGDFTVHALRGVSLEFRKNEFVAILGPSGCGKTTMLNIVGGLDRYTSGDLNIDGRSTKDFKDKDWDAYRNHSVGFVFQSYNLIPHQTVLGNVELALTIAGMSKAERIAKAKAALDKVGLSDQYRKRPNQMSGGQMQRVAIARALVNDPEIVLADEPTGALDTVTSRQIMDLLREIAKERLVIMVTHNSEIADQYSTRIIRLKDGEVIEDTNPFKGTTTPQSAKKTKKQVATEAAAETATIQETERKRRAKMSLFTAFRLSLQNLISKKRRSMVVSIAGSIGIIGVSLVLAFSFGIQGFITNMQRDMLSGNPIHIEQTTFDINAMMRSNSVLDDIQLTFQDGFANIDAMLARMKERATTVNDVMVENTIVEDYIRFLNDMSGDYLAALHYDYGLNVAPSIFTTYTDLDHTTKERDLSLTAIRAVFGSLLDDATEDIEGMQGYASMINMVASSFSQLPANNGNATTTNNYILSQYNLVDGGRIASAKNEINIVLGHDRLISDILLTQLGYFSQQEFMNIMYRLLDKQDKVDPSIPDRGDQISYSELKDKSFTWYNNDVIFSKNDGGTPGLTPPPNSQQYAFDYHSRADNNLRFQGLVEDEDFIDLKVVGILQPKPNMNFGMLQSGVFYTTELAEFIIETNNTSDIVAAARRWEDVTQPPSWLPQFPPALPLEARTLALYYFTWDYTFEGSAPKPVESTRGVEMLRGPIPGLMGMLRNLISSAPTSTQLGGGVYASGKPIPHLIEVYPASLEIKPKVLSYLRQWNRPIDITLSDGYVIKYVIQPESEPGAGDEITREQIMYSDPLSLVFSMISQLVDIVTIALVAFTSLALVVSCVMIGIITYISVVERIKEIGVIRSLGGRKRDVANLFTAETFILGFAAGVIGVSFTYLLSWSASALIWQIAGIANIAFLPCPVALVMVALSVGLTFISGILPSRSAARKDPVVALRTE